ncbi:MAG TPA: porin family protein [Vicinamibacterales bacterium]|nr:porin family protein [Vicinamibacterales bacterium]
MTSLARTLVVGFVFVAATLCLPAPSAAQVYINPFFGYNFGGDTGCAGILDCEDKNFNWGAAFGAVGPIVGGELELGYTNGFFGDSATTQTAVTTIMGNFLLAPRFGPIQPYGLAGLGLIRSKVEETVAEEDQNDFGYDVGGGVFIHFSRHVGARIDFRYFHSFNPLEVLGLDVQENKLDFSRFSGGVVFRF